MNWLARLKSGLEKSAAKLAGGISGIAAKRKLNEEALEELEELLISCDLGAAAAKRIVKEFTRTRFGKEATDEDIRAALASEIAKILAPVAKELVLGRENNREPEVILLVGVNGGGKTTTLGKLAYKFRQQGKTVMLAACDTFRAAAVEQLKIWGKRAGCEVIAGVAGADPASVAFHALERARAEKAGVLLLDTAGRLQNKKGLMEELAKIIRVLKKIDETAPHHTLLVLDATTGQNARSQTAIFKDMAQISGLIVTKLDGTAKGGIVVALAEEFRLPVYAIGAGEGLDDLHQFNPDDFARGMVGL